MKKLLLAGLLALSLGLSARADLKIALIDTSKAFDAFYKTKDMAVHIAARKATFEKEIRDLQEEYEDASNEAQNLEEAIKDPTAAVDIRKSKDTALAQKVQDLKSIEGEIDQVRKDRSQELHDELIRSHQEISEEMMKVITAYVSSQGYDLVLDKSATGPAAPSLFPYNSVKIIDLTEQIIDRLNASAPRSRR